MSTSPLSAEEVRAAAGAHRELGSEYSDAVVESFLHRLDKEIADRVDARLASAAPAPRRRTLTGKGSLVKGVAAGAVLTGIPFTTLAVFLGHRSYESGFAVQLILVWIFVIAVNLAWVGWRRNPPDKPE
jgi:hypothetical protein